jgi:hypothetical protein
MKSFLVVAGLVAGGAHDPAPWHSVSCVPVVTVCSPAAPDTIAPAKPAKPRKAEKLSKITISDDGIKIESGGEEKVIVSTDEGKAGAVSVKVRTDLKNLPESLETVFGDDEDKRFYNVKSSDVVQLGRRIDIGPNELVNGDVVAIGSNIHVEGKVMGDVAAIFGSVELSPTAIVNGEVVSILGEVQRENGSIVRGETAVIGSHRHGGLTVPFGCFGEGLFGAGAKIVLFIISVLLMLIVLYFIAQRMTAAASYVGGSFLKSLGVGLLVIFAGSVLVLILSIILAITIVGIPVAVLLVLSFVALFVLGYFVAALALGAFVCRKFNMESDSVYVHGIIGLFLLAILGIIASFMFFAPWMGPFRALLRVFGGLIGFVAMTTGVGAFILSRGGSTSGAPKVARPE